MWTNTINQLMMKQLFYGFTRRNETDIHSHFGEFNKIAFLEQLWGTNGWGGPCGALTVFSHKYLFNTVVWTLLAYFGESNDYHGLESAYRDEGCGEWKLSNDSLKRSEEYFMDRWSWREVDDSLDEEKLYNCGVVWPLLILLSNEEERRRVTNMMHKVVKEV